MDDVSDWGFLQLAIDPTVPGEAVRVEASSSWFLFLKVWNFTASLSCGDIMRLSLFSDACEADVTIMVWDLSLAHNLLLHCSFMRSWWSREHHHYINYTNTNHYWASGGLCDLMSWSKSNAHHNKRLRGVSKHQALSANTLWRVCSDEITDLSPRTVGNRSERSSCSKTWSPGCPGSSSQRGSASLHVVRLHGTH